MSHYILIRRLRWPAVLLLAGIIALLHQTGLIDSFWHLFIPLLLITMGLLLLAERMALNAEGGYPSPYAGGPYAGAPYGGTTVPAATQPTAVESTSIVPASHDFGDGPNGGQQ